jgi:hypothetical protein
MRPCFWARRIERRSVLLTKIELELFNLGEAAKGLAWQVGVTEPWSGNGSDRFAYFADERRFVIVAGQQEGGYVDLAFAQGLEQRGSRQLVLILPEDRAFATLQRAPWFKAEARPVVYLHDGVTAHVCDLPTQGVGDQGATAGC